MDIAKLRELLDRIESADGAEATHRAFIEWAQAVKAVQPSLLARLEAAEGVVEAAKDIADWNDFDLSDFSPALLSEVADLRTALTTYDQEKARG